MLKEELRHITVENLLDRDEISVRAKNCCTNNGLNTLYDIVLYFENSGSFFNKKIKNAGNRTCNELDDLCKRIIPKNGFKKQKIEINAVLKIINELQVREREVLFSLANLIINAGNSMEEKQRLFNHHCRDSFSFAIDFYKRNGHFPMFWILEQYLKNDETRDVQVIINTFPIFQDKNLYTLEDTASIYGLTRERVRQIRNDIFHKTFEITDEIIKYKKKNHLVEYRKLLQDKDDWDYILELLQEDESINHESIIIRDILEKEQCKLSTAFVLQIIGYIFRDKYLLLNGLSVSNKKSFNSTFLIKKEYTTVFNFERFIDEFANHIAENEIEYELDVDQFLSNSSCWVSAIDLNNFDGIVAVLKNILLCEFQLYSNLEGLIVVPATKRRNLFDVVYEILWENAGPMHLNEIFVEFKNTFPEHKYTQEDNAERLRPYLQRHEKISYRNRGSIYTLQEWGHIRTGTIRDTIIEFLEQHDVPKTVDSIMDFVLPHFPNTNIASVRTSMLNDTKGRFSYFNSNLFGLVSKEYPSEYEETKPQIERKSFEQRLYDLEKFLTENDHFPFSSSDNKDETSLYRWWQIQNKKLSKLTARQKSEIERVKSQHADYDTDKSIYEWFCHLNNFKLFVLENRRLPSIGSSEIFLYRWFRRTKDDFSNQRLNEKQKRKYVELFKEINYAEK